MEIKTIRSLLCLAVALLCVGSRHAEVNAQTMAQRNSLVTALNTGRSSLGTLIATDSTSPHSVVVSIPGGITVKGYDGGCNAPSNLVLEYVPDTEPGGLVTRGIRLGVTLRSSSSMDIPEYSHVLVCELNNMLWHFTNGNHRINWTLDANGNPVITDRNYDASCTATTSQKFWMIDEGVAYGTDYMSPAGAIWHPTQVNDGRLLNNTTSIEEDGLIYSADFVDPANAGKNIWIARRHDANDGRFEIKRAYTKVDFDYDYIDYVVGGNHDYIDAFNDPGWGYDKKLTAIELKAQTHDYAPNICPQNGVSPVVQPLSDRAQLTMTIYYETSAGACSTICVETWQATPVDRDADNQALWGRMFGDYGRGWGEFDIDENGVLFFRKTGTCPPATGSCSTGATDKFGLIKLRDRTVPADKCEIMLGLSGTFSVDDMTGEILYTASSVTERIFCFDFCDTLSGYLTFDNVLSASAQTYHDQWSYDPAMHGTWNAGQNAGSPHHGSDVFDPYFGMPDNAFQRSERGKWRADKGYVYRSTVKSGVGANRIYDAAGVFVDENGNTDDVFRLFNWSNPGDNVDNWVNPVTITQYDPSGELAEEHNIVNQYSTVRLAHDEVVANLVAKNATYDAVDFESFEEFSPAGSYTDDCAHSGELSYQLADNGTYSASLASVKLTDQIDVRGLLIKLWVKQSYNVFDANPGFSNSPIAIQVGAQTFSTIAPANYNTLDPGFIYKVAQTGEWSLYQLVVSSFGAASVDDPLPIAVKNNIPTIHNDRVWVDDIRVQPFNSVMACFVYDRQTLRPIAQFDDHHFGVYSRYNGAGHLVGVSRETERGVMTVSESQAWLMSQSRFVTPGGTSPGVPVQMSSLGVDRSGFDQSSSIRGGRGTDFDIASLRIGPDGPSVDLFGGKNMPLEELQELLDFSADFPNIETEKLAALAPDLPAVERLQLVRELMKLDKERAQLGEELKGAVDEEKAKRYREGLKAIDEKRDEILLDKLGLTSEEIQALYKEIDSDSEDEETEDDRTNN